MCSVLVAQGKLQQFIALLVFIGFVFYLLTNIKFKALVGFICVQIYKLEVSGGRQEGLYRIG